MDCFVPRWLVVLQLQVKVLGSPQVHRSSPLVVVQVEVEEQELQEVEQVVQIVHLEGKVHLVGRWMFQVHQVMVLHP